MKARIEAFLRELLLEQHSLAQMLQVLDIIEKALGETRDALLKVFGAQSANDDDDEPKGHA